jgi:hypothetical protein
VEAGAPTIWSPQIFEARFRCDRPSRRGRAGASARWSRTETSSDQPPGECHGYELSDFPGVRRIFRSLVRYDLGLLVRGTAAGSKRPSRVKAGQVEAPHVGAPARCRLTTRSRPFEPASEKAADFSAALLVFRLSPTFSVAIGADSDADAGRADADAATFLIAAALDITLAARGISV